MSAAAPLVDLSSDTATRPTAAMRRAMYEAAVGDEQRGEDPTVLELEAMVADLVGKPEAVFLPSGTMCNVIAIFVHCSPGDEVILHRDSHPDSSENAGPAVHARVSLRVVDGVRGTFTGSQVAAAIQPPGPQRAHTRLVSVENTHNRGGGTVWSVDAIEEVCRVAAAHGLATHLDGARLLNAAVASDAPAASFCRPFDSVWIDLSKGLGCPVGAVLAGSADFVAEARWAKHLFGGAMRQAGVIAAAGVHALGHQVDRLADDHALATELARGLAEIRGVSLPHPPETNIVLFDVDAAGIAPAQFLERTERLGVRFSVARGSVLRAVTHMDVAPTELPRALAAVRRVLEA